MEEKILTFLSLPIGEHTPIFISIMVLWFIISLINDMIVIWAISITFVLIISCFANTLLENKKG